MEFQAVYNGIVGYGVVMSEMGVLELGVMVVVGEFELDVKKMSL